MTPSRLVDRVRAGVESLTPGYFALVMASGIVSVGLHLEGHALLSRVLLGVCATAFVVLLGLTLWRLVSYRSSVNDDFMDPRRAFGFFTFVAGTNVLGVRLGLERWYSATAVLLVVSGAAWLVLGYVVPWTAVLGRQERPVVAGANGTWFICPRMTAHVEFQHARGAHPTSTDSDRPFWLHGSRRPPGRRGHPDHDPHDSEATE